MRPRPRRCTICRRPDRAQIEGALALGLSCAAVADRFGCSGDALWRHRRSHMDPAHIAAILLGRKAAEIDLEALQRSEGDRLLAEIVDQRVRLRAVRDMALGHGALGFVFMAESSIRACLEFEARLLAPILAQRLQAKDVSRKIERIERVVISPTEDEPSSNDPASPATDAVEAPAPPPSPSPEAEPPHSTYSNVISRPLFGRYGSQP